MQAPKKPKIAFLLVAAILSAAIAWGFFMDPIIATGLGALGLPPPRIQLPEWSFSELMGGEEQIDTTTDPHGQSPQRPWWEGIFGNVIPDVEHSVEISTPPPEDWFQTDSPESEDGQDLGFCTEEEMIELCYDPLVKALGYLEAEQHAELIPPVDRVGLFDLDLNGVPEIITISRSDGYVEYTAYELYSVERLTSWGWETKDSGDGELMLANPSLAISGVYYRTLLMHEGDGDDNFICEITRNKFEYTELFAQIQEELSWGDTAMEGSAILHQFRMYGEATDEKTYFDAYERFKVMNIPLYETKMITVEWYGAQPESMAKKILTSGQRFLRVGK